MNVCLKQSRLQNVWMAIGCVLVSWCCGPKADAFDWSKWEISSRYVKKGADGTKLFSIPFPPEKAGAKGVKWRPAPGKIDASKTWVLDSATAMKGEHFVAYLRTTVNVKKNVKGLLELGSDDGVKVWVNGKLVHANNVGRGVKPGEDKVTIQLKKGSNRLLLKVNQGSGGWGAAAKLTLGAAGAVAVVIRENNNSLTKVYSNYRPPFSNMKSNLKFSRQKHFDNVADVQVDAQIDPLLKKADSEAFGKGRWRKAISYYRKIIQEYPDELYQIADEGIFIPVILYAQRQILSFPEKERSYYRILYDPTAKVIYKRAVHRFSILDYKDLVRFHLATSYGDDALFALGNAALDGGRYDEARKNYDRIIQFHGVEDKDRDDIKLDRDQVWVRLAMCHRHLGEEERYQEALGKIKSKQDKTVAKLLSQLANFKYDAFAVHQRENQRSRRFTAADDKSLADDMPYEFAANRGSWRIPLSRRPGRSRQHEVAVLPWATETDLIYKDMNVLYSRSLLTGELNWSFGPGGSSLDWDRYGAYRGMTAFYPKQSILVHDGVVFSHMFVYGPSLAAIDQNTGRMLWAKGPMAATSEDEWLDRYQASPAAGRGTVIAPVVHDDIRGRTHVASTAELASFDSRTGKLIWRKWLARISPLKITQSRYPRKIRIFSSTPLVKEGIVYHSTNAGVVAALDAETGSVRWLTRYPQRKIALDNFSNPGRIWTNEPPVIRGNLLFVTPADCGHLLCLNTDTGRIIWTATGSCDSTWVRGRRAPGRHQAVWRMGGFSPQGNLLLSGKGIVFLNPKNGRLVWHKLKGIEPGITGEGKDFWFNRGHIYAQPTMTKGGKLLFSMQSWFGDPGPNQGPFNSDYTVDLKTRSVTLQRRWYAPISFVHHFGYASKLTVIKRPVNEEPESFEPSIRMAFSRWNVPFEVNVTHNHIVARYDRKKLNAELTNRKDLNTLFAKGEMARKRGDIKAAVAFYESCKTVLPSEEEDMRRNINLRLYPLYRQMVIWGHQAADHKLLDLACRKMGATASNPEQEIRALLAFSEFHEKRGDMKAAVRVLQNASRHYWREPLRVSSVELEDPEVFKSRAQLALKHLMMEVPAPYKRSLQQIVDLEQGSMDDYRLSVANVRREHVVETRNIIVKRLKMLLKKAPAEFFKGYEADAETELQRYNDPRIGERLLWCWPRADAAKARLGQLLNRTPENSAKKGNSKGEQQGQKWRFDDLAWACDLVPDAKRVDDKDLKQVGTLSGLPSGDGWKGKVVKNEDPEMVRLALSQEGNGEATSSLLFVGGRKRRSYGNRFNVVCWDLKSDKQVWASPEILLHGRASKDGEGFEVGFEKVFIRGDLAFVHGRYDVIAFNWRAGEELYQEGMRKGKKKKHWHFRVPMGFEIKAAGLCGDVLILNGRSSTVALSATKGTHPRILWAQREAGEFYAGPYFHKGTVLSIRRAPTEVAFRKVGSGRLLSRLQLPGLTNNRKHPIFAGDAASRNPQGAAAAEAYPVACKDGILAITDATSYHVVDIEKRQVRWSRPASKLDRSVEAAYRLWINQGRLFVLKPYYSVLENVVFDLESGDMLWRRREGGKKIDLKKFAGQDSAHSGGKEVVGLMLSSMTFVDGNVYGVKYEMGGSNVQIVGMDPKTGNEIMKIKQKGYADVEAYIEPCWSKDCIVVRIQDGNKFELLQVDVKAKKVVQRIKMNGYGKYGNYGEASAVWQGPHLVLWTYEKRTVTGSE